MNRPIDMDTAQGFATSWNTLGEGSIYTWDQFLDWMSPLEPDDFRGQRVLELGFGNGSLLVHLARCEPAQISGIELGDTIETARRNVRDFPAERLDLREGDLTTSEMGEFDVVYCIGVLHHLASPEDGFGAVLRHTRPGGRFHCWVYAREGNAIVRWIVDPLRRFASRLPWWLNKYGLALPLALKFFVYAKTIRLFEAWLRPIRGVIPLFEYSLWIGRREFRFFHHVAFDQLVARRTAYLPRTTIESWLESPDVLPGSAYLEMRNGNSWKFGGRKRVP